MIAKIDTIVITSAFHPVEGGIETYMYQVAKNWPFGESIVFTQHAGPDQLESHLPFAVHRLPYESGAYFLSLFKLARLVRFNLKICFLLAANRDFVKCSARRVFSIVRELKHGKGCVIQASTVIPNGVIGLIVKKMFHSKLVVYIHGAEINRYRQKINNRWLMKTVFASADLIIANSRYTAGLITEWVRNPDSVCTVNIGVDTNRFHPLDSRERIRRRLNLPADAYVFLTLARLIRRKGHDHVLKALADLSANHGNVFYVIAGRGPEEKRLKELARTLGVSKNVRFAGFVGEDQLNDTINACDCFVMANREEAGDVEGYGLVFIEAGACGKPVIAGRSGGAVDAVLDNVTGFLVDPLRSDEIADRMELIMTDRELAHRLGDAGFNRAREELTWQKVCQKINSHIFELMA